MICSENVGVRTAGKTVEGITLPPNEIFDRPVGLRLAETRFYKVVAAALGLVAAYSGGTHAIHNTDDRGRTTVLGTGAANRLGLNVPTHLDVQYIADDRWYYLRQGGQCPLWYPSGSEICHCT